MVSRMKKEDELPNVPASNDLEQLEKQIQELERMKAGMIQQQDPTELMFKIDYSKAVKALAVLALALSAVFLRVSASLRAFNSVLFRASD